jgi:hypothetical protein
MPSHGSNNNGRSVLRLPSGCRHKEPKISGNEGGGGAALYLEEKCMDDLKKKGAADLSQINIERGK